MNTEQGTALEGAAAVPVASAAVNAALTLLFTSGFSAGRVTAVA